MSSGVGRKNYWGTRLEVLIDVDFFKDSLNVNKDIVDEITVCGS